MFINNIHNKKILMSFCEFFMGYLYLYFYEYICPHVFKKEKNQFAQRCGR